MCIPKKDSAFAVWSRNLLVYVQAHLAVFCIHKGVIQPLLDLQTTFETAYAKALTPDRDAVDTASKDHARDTFEKALYSFIKAFLLHSPFVSDNDRDEMQILAYDTGACEGGGPDKS
ncbi:MAG: hypothetical protein LBH75_00625 [Treponema sp.]|jgi:hypothetical protein|nr:hypothetical protein [Treponema sp.]